MVHSNDEATLSRRSILKRTTGAVAVAVGGGSLAGAEVGAARRGADSRADSGVDSRADSGVDSRADSGVDSRADSRGGSGTDSREVYEAVTCGDDHSEGSRLTVGRYCEGDGDCDVIQLAGLSPDCHTEEKRLYVVLPDTDPTVWMNPQKGEIPPGTYRVDRAERCEGSAGECDGEDLYHLSLRPVES
ncbi:hypothetical protein [Halorussus ruber]|uniref:hypothetical protein n=1 Tax=Halorussus ruber TaxID=1126238 RepID=UPI001091FF9A|nr:hypothetical protein [Halorussus ruber]